MLTNVAKCWSEKLVKHIKINGNACVSVCMWKNVRQSLSECDKQENVKVGEKKTTAEAEITTFIRQMA